MIKGEKISLRLVGEKDLDTLYQQICDLSNRGHFYPQMLIPESQFKKDFYTHGFWDSNFDRMLIINKQNQMIGQIFCFKAAIYVDALEIGYILFNEKDYGQGYTTEALQLFVAHLFANRAIGRIQLRIHPDNIASKKVAKKAGFQFDGTRKQIMFMHGKHVDADEYAIIRRDFDKLS